MMNMVWRESSEKNNTLDFFFFKNGKQRQIQPVKTPHGKEIFFFLSNGKEVLVALKNNAAKLRSGPVG